MRLTAMNLVEASVAVFGYVEGGDELIARVTG